MSKILNVAQLGQPILRQVTKEVSAEEIASPEFQQFLDDMLTTLQSQQGVGLAAPQVYSGHRVFLAAVIDEDEEAEADGQESSEEDEDRSVVGVEVFINPVIEAVSKEQESDWEGCLSFRELLVLVPRHVGLRVRYLDRDGEPQRLELLGYSARVIQHEFDHLEGILTIDRAVTTKNIIKASEIEAVRPSSDSTDH